MSRDIQYHTDSTRLATLIERYTGIPQDRVYHFVLENSAGKLLPFANKLCENDSQREKLTALFEFKTLYETVKSADKDQVYIINSTEKAKEYFINLFSELSDKERVIVAFTDGKHQIIRTKVMSVGTVDQASVQIREIIKEALFNNANGAIVSHNHISGTLRPSEEDRVITGQINSAMSVVGLNLLDHIVVAGDKAFSLADLGMIQTPERSKSAQELNEKSYGYEKRAPSVKAQLAMIKAHRAETFSAGIQRENEHKINNNR